ncbi:MAG: hypothetical protein VX938_14220, partial [Myxococcota bacterium]|nr:hypothetical protein [Myxococcota bacterium]
MIGTLAACSSQGSGSGATDDATAEDTSVGDAQGETSDGTGPTADTIETPEIAPPAPSDDELRGAFFTLTDTHLVEIQLSEYSVDKLWEDPYSYVSGDVTIDGESLPGSGVRLKGVYGS